MEMLCLQSNLVCMDVHDLWLGLMPYVDAAVQIEWRHQPACNHHDIAVNAAVNLVCV